MSVEASAASPPLGAGLRSLDLAPWLLILPLLISLGSVSVYPIVNGVWLSLTNTSLVTQEDAFVGLANYRTLLGDDAFWNAWGHTVLFTAVSTALETVLGLAMGFLLYGVGAWLGLRRVRAIAAKVPLLHVEDVDRTVEWFGRHGGKAVFFGRMVPIFRSLISIPAGVVRMPLWRFGLLTLAGSAIWNAVFVLAGFFLGESWHVVETYADILQYVVIVGTVTTGIVLAAASLFLWLVAGWSWGWLLLAVVAVVTAISLVIAQRRTRSIGYRLATSWGPKDDPYLTLGTDLNAFGQGLQENIAIQQLAGTSIGNWRAASLYRSSGNGASYAATTSGASSDTVAPWRMNPVGNDSTFWENSRQRWKASPGSRSPVGRNVLLASTRAKRSGCSATRRIPSSPPQSWQKRVTSCRSSWSSTRERSQSRWRW